MRGPLSRAVTRWVNSPFFLSHSPGVGSIRSCAQIPIAAAGHKAPKRRSLVWWTAVGVGTGGLIGLVAGYDQVRRSRAVIPNSEEQGPILLSQLPDVKASRHVKFPSDVSGLKLTLFQYQTCPFCCKVRALLDFCGISYDVVEVNSITRKQMKWSQNYKKVPILIVETPQGDIIQLNDSSMIVSSLYSYLFANSGKSSVKEEENTLLNIAKFYPSITYNNDVGKTQTDIMNKYFLMLDGDMSGRTKEEIMEERKWRKWADDVFVHMLSPNIYRTIPEALDSFRYFDKVGEWEKNFTQWERSVIIYLGASAMYIIGKRLQKRHHLKSDVRQSLFEQGDFWVDNIKKKGGEFMGGQTPDLSDLAVYGVLSSIEGCQAFKDLTTHSRSLERWYHSVKMQLKSI